MITLRMMKVLKYPYEMTRMISRNKTLIRQFIRRDITSRYKGSLLGVIWTIIMPIVMLIIYTFVFGFVFKSRWGSEPNNKMAYALVLFCGITTFNLFGEIVTRSPSIILSNSNFVKKVVFPLEILPVSLLGSALVNFFIGFIIIILGYVIFLGVPHITVLLLPIVIAPLLLLSIGLSWVLASLGVYFRDIGQITGILIQALMYLTPIFYPLSAVPIGLRGLYDLNPLAFFVEMTRDILIWGIVPNMIDLCIWLFVTFLIAVFGYTWFQKTKRGFADVV